VIRGLLLLTSLLLLGGCASPSAAHNGPAAIVDNTIAAAGTAAAAITLGPLYGFLSYFGFDWIGDFLSKLWFNSELVRVYTPEPTPGSPPSQSFPSTATAMPDISSILLLALIGFGLKWAYDIWTNHKNASFSDKAAVLDKTDLEQEFKITQLQRDLDWLETEVEKLKVK
jgi:hypothetical protein